jgi:hypothetical protein
MSTINAVLLRSTYAVIIINLICFFTQNYSILLQLPYLPVYVQCYFTQPLDCAGVKGSSDMEERRGAMVQLIYEDEDCEGL